MLEDLKDILEEPPPQPEMPRDREYEAATTARNLRDKLARDRAMLENEGTKVYYKEVQKKLVSIIFLSLGTGGKKSFLQKKPLAEASNCHLRKLQNLHRSHTKKLIA